MQNDENKFGKVIIDKEVLGTIAAEAAKKVKGVYKIATSLVGGIAKLIKKSPDIGIKVIVGEEEINFELKIVIDYGANIPEITHQVQKQIKEDIENMCGLKVGKVDVIVSDIKK